MNICFLQGVFRLAYKMLISLIAARFFFILFIFFILAIYEPVRLAASLILTVIVDVYLKKGASSLQGKTEEQLD